jgi:hypothetical protein
MHTLFDCLPVCAFAHSLHAPTLCRAYLEVHRGLLRRVAMTARN